MRFNEGIDIKIVYCDDTPSEYIDDVTMNDIYDILDSSSDICKIVDISGSKKKVVWTDEYGFEHAYESKKSVCKSMKESKDTNFFNAMAKKFNFTKDEIKRYKDKTYISVIGVLFDRIRSVPTHSDEWYNAMNDCWEGIQVAEDNGFNVDYEKKTYDKIIMTPNYNRESKKSDKKSMKESYNKKDGDKYKIIGYKGKNETFVIYVSKRNGVFDYTMTKDYVLSHFPNKECDTNDIDDLNYFVKYEGLGQLIYGYLYDNGRLENNVISIEAVRGKKLEVTINIDEQGAKLLKNGWWSEKESTSFFGYSTCDGSFDSYWQIQDDGTAKIYLELDIYSDGELLKESKVDYQSVLNSVLPKEYANNKNAYKYALSCVTSLYNEDEYDSDNAKVYFLNCYLSDSFPWWVDELGEEEMDALANGLYDGLMKWKDIDKSWFEE